MNLSHRLKIKTVKSSFLKSTHRMAREEKTSNISDKIGKDKTFLPPHPSNLIMWYVLNLYNRALPEGHCSLNP